MATRSVRFVLIAFALLALGCVAMFLATDAGDSGTTESPAYRQASARQGDDDGDTSVAPVVAEHGEEESTSARQDQVRDAGAEDAAFRESVVSKIVTPTAVSGVLRGADGAPAVATTVELRVSIVENDRNTTRDVESVVTDESGAFRLTLGADARISDYSVAWLVASTADSAILMKNLGRLEKGRETRLDALVLERAGPVRAIVRDHAGSPVAGAQVTPHGFPGLQRSTDVDGRCSFPALPGGTCRFSATKDGFATCTSDSLEVRLDALLEVALTLPAADDVSGRVVDSEGRPLQDVMVAAHGMVTHTRTAMDGTFRLAGIAKGSVKLRVIARGFAVLEIPDVAVPSRDHEIRLEGSPAIEGRAIDVATKAPVDLEDLRIEHVSDPTSAALTNHGPATVLLRLVSFSWQQRYRVETDRRWSPIAGSGPAAAIQASALTDRLAGGYCDADGRFRVYGKLDGAVFLVARSEGDARAVAGPIPIEPGTSGTLSTTIEFGAGGAIEVEVVDAASGAPISGANCEVAMFGATSSTGSTDASGIARCSGLSAGSASVIVAADGHAPGIAVTEVTKGEIARVRLSLDAGVRVEGRVVGLSGTPLSDATIAFDGAASRGFDVERAVTDAEGHYSIEHVLPGTRTVQIEPHDANASGMLFGSALTSEGLGLVIEAEITTTPEQQLDIATRWPAAAEIAAAFIVGGSGVTDGQVEIRRENEIGKFELAPDRYGLKEGVLRVPRAAPGRYFFSVNPRGSAWYSSPIVELKGGEVFANAQTIRTTQALTGRVEDQSGAAIVGASVYFLWNDGWRKRIHGGRAVSPFADLDATSYRTQTLGDGSFFLPPGQMDGHLLMVTARKLQSVQLVVDDDTARRVPLQFRLRPPEPPPAQKPGQSPGQSPGQKPGAKSGG